MSKDTQREVLEKSIKPGQKFKILRWHDGEALTDMDNLVTVKVLRLYENAKHGTLVEYRYNWPFTLANQVPIKKFKSWIAHPVKDS